MTFGTTDSKRIPQLGSTSQRNMAQYYQLAKGGTHERNNEVLREMYHAGKLSGCLFQ
jgi:hypothetical protein